MSTAKKTKPELWQKKVSAAKAKFGKWSARAAQWATAEYKKAGGGYSGAKSSSNSLSKWTKQKWRTKSGKKSSETGERYLPSAAIKALSPAEYAATTRAKRKGTKSGKQFVKQPKRIAKKVRKYR